MATSFNLLCCCQCCGWTSVFGHECTSERSRHRYTDTKTHIDTQPHKHNHTDSQLADTEVAVNEASLSVSHCSCSSQIIEVTKHLFNFCKPFAVFLTSTKPTQSSLKYDLLRLTFERLNFLWRCMDESVESLEGGVVTWYILDDPFRHRRPESVSLSYHRLVYRFVPPK